MVVQIIQDSPWHYIFAFLGITLPIAAIIMVISRADKGMKRHHTVILGGMTAVIIICIVGLIMGGQQRMEQNDANFSKQLMDEYGVTSSRSFYDIDSDFLRFNEANTVFTKDGKDTAIFIKRVHNADTQETLVFTVIDEKSLFPKLTK